ncbi:MAG: hypothetical protein ABI772_07380 [Bacteroidota bacterium]
MKKHLCLIIVLLLIVKIDFATASSFYKPKPIIVKIQKHCDAGFGLCLLIPMGRVSVPDRIHTEASVGYADGKIVLSIEKDNLSPELLKDFESNYDFPVDEDVILPEDIIEQLQLPANAALAEGRYVIRKDADTFQVSISLVK